MADIPHDFDLEWKYLGIPKIPGLEKFNTVRWGPDAHFAIVGILLHHNIEPSGRYVGVIAFFADEFSVHRALRKLGELYPIEELGNKLFEPRRTEVCSTVGGKDWKVFHVKEMAYGLDHRRKSLKKNGSTS